MVAASLCSHPQLQEECRHRVPGPLGTPWILSRGELPSRIFSQELAVALLTLISGYAAMWVLAKASSGTPCLLILTKFWCVHK